MQSDNTDPFSRDDLSSLSLQQLRARRGWQQRYRLLISWADCIAAKPALRCEANRVAGCETAAWLAHRRRGELHQFAIDAESRIVRGLGALLLVMLNNRSTGQLRDLDIAAQFTALGLDKHLSPSRGSGLRAIVSQAYQRSGIDIR